MKLEMMDLIGLKPVRSMGRSILGMLLLFTLAGCGALPQGWSPFAKTPETLPTVVLGGAGAPTAAPSSAASPRTGGAGVTASGIVATAEQIRPAFSLAGKVEAVEVALGDLVQAGQVIARLSGSEKLAAAVEAANLELLTAQQAQDKLGEDMDVRQAQAWQAVLDARETYSDTLQARDNLNSLAGSASADNARRGLENALALVRRLREAYDRLPGTSETSPEKARALFELKMARIQAEVAQKKVDEFGEAPDPEELERANADLAVAQATLEKTRRDFESLQGGPDPADVELAEARVTAAAAQLAAAKSGLADLELRAPIRGTVTALYIHAGEWASPGQPALVLTDLQGLRVETTDLSEMDVPGIDIGQPVRVVIKALDQEVAGRVLDISPLADTLGGDVVYKTTIELEEIPSGLRVGMSVEVQFLEGE